MKLKIRFRNSMWVKAMALTVLSVSCNLEIEETDSIITNESTVFNGVANPASQIDQIYNNIRGQTEDQAGLYALTEVTTDELLVPTRGTDWGDNGVWRTLHAHTWSPTHSYVTGVWNDKNSAVLRATEVLDPLTKTASPADKAHAKFTRAYNMWIIMDFYGQVPFRNPSDGPKVVPSVMSRSEAYDFVVKDLTDAINELPNSNPVATDKTRAVKATARFLLAKVKLNGFIYKGESAPSDADLQDVISLVDAIEAEGYSITGPGTYFNTFKGKNVSNPDVIWSVSASDGNRMWSGLHYNQVTPDNTGGGWNGFTTLAEFYDKFQGPPTSNVAGGPQEERRGLTQTLATTTGANYTVDPPIPGNQGFGYGFQIGQMYGWRYGDGKGGESGGPTKIPDTDPAQYYDPIGHSVTLKDRTGNPLAFTKELPGLIGNNEVTGIRVLKYSPADGGFASGVVMARFADAYLMRAEAMLRLGNTAGALTEVNDLRAMRNNTPALPSMTLDIMLDERGRELYTEGWRRNDMVRFGAFKGSWQFKDASEGSADGHTDLFPIPSSALLSNPGLVQNPGY